MVGGMGVMVLWAMSLWGAAVILVVTGYGGAEWKKWRVSRATMAVMGCMVWGLGWWTVTSTFPGVRVDMGLLLVVTFAWALVAAWGPMRWWVLTGILGMMGIIIRIMVPVVTHQTQLMPVGTIESVGLGVASGLSLGEAMPAAIVATASEGLAVVVVAWRHGTIHNLGRHDLAMTLLALLAAWMVGWVVQRIWVRMGHIA